MSKLECTDAVESPGAGHWRRIVLSQMRANEGSIVFGRLSAWEEGLLRQMEAEGLIERGATQQRPITVRLKRTAGIERDHDLSRL